MKNLIRKILKEETEKSNNPCKTGYTMIGMKKKNGKKVPNCVPLDEDLDYWGVSDANSDEYEMGPKS